MCRTIGSCGRSASYRSRSAVCAFVVRKPENPVVIETVKTLAALVIGPLERATRVLIRRLA